jgi:hypothetical protein
MNMCLMVGTSRSPAILLARHILSGSELLWLPSAIDRLSVCCLLPQNNPPDTPSTELLQPADQACSFETDRAYSIHCITAHCTDTPSAENTQR